MDWQHPLACFFGGLFFANFAPHWIAGVSGRPHPTPFATPPFRGRSSPVVNVLWGLANLAVAYLLLGIVGGFALGRAATFAPAALGFTLASLGIARSTARLQGTQT